MILCIIILFFPFILYVTFCSKLLYKYPISNLLCYIRTIFVRCFLSLVITKNKNELILINKKMRPDIFFIRPHFFMLNQVIEGCLYSLYLFLNLPTFVNLFGSFGNLPVVCTIASSSQTSIHLPHFVQSKSSII